MPEHKSFRPSDFSVRDIPGFIVAYLIISAASVAAGLLVEGLPDFWKGALLAAGCVMLVFYPLFRRGK